MNEAPIRWILTTAVYPHLPQNEAHSQSRLQLVVRSATDIGMAALSRHIDRHSLLHSVLGVAPVLLRSTHARSIPDK